MWHIFQPTNRQYSKGFTLSELLVSLSVLGLIAAFAVPKLVTSLNEAQRRDLFRTTIRTLTEASSKATNEPPTLTAPNNTTWHVYENLLNSADDNFVALGDADNSFTLPGGVLLSRFIGRADDGGEAILIDVNGAGAPNNIGEDQLMVTTCFNPTGTCPALANITVNSAAQEAGIVGPTPDITGGAGNVAFFNQLI